MSDPKDWIGKDKGVSYKEAVAGANAHLRAESEKLNNSRTEEAHRIGSRIYDKAKASGEAKISAQKQLAGARAKAAQPLHQSVQGTPTAIQVGPRGGQYTLGPGGTKVYVKK